MGQKGNSPSGMPDIANRKMFSVTALGFLTAATVVTSLRSLPMMAQEELTMFFYIGIAAVLFLIPAGLVAAELGSAFSDRTGGVYTWVGEAFTPKLGFVAIWLQWIECIVWYPTELGFAAAAVAYAVGDNSIAQNTYYIGGFCILAYLVATLIALTGTQLLVRVAQFGFLVGIVFPCFILIVLAVWWVVSGNPVGWETLTNPEVAVRVDGYDHPRWFPHINGLGAVAFLGAILLAFAGVEAQATHVSEMRNARHGYPIVIGIAAVTSILIFTLGALSIAAILPYKEISVETGLFVAFERAFERLLGIEWPVQALSWLIGYGALSGALAWLAGPSRGLLATAQDGMLPPWFQRENRIGVQKNILYAQFIVVALISSIYIVMENVATAFVLISAMAISLYIIMYLLMFAAVIRLRITRPDLPRSFRIPGGLVGVWITAGTGLASVIFALIVSFFPPEQLTIKSPITYVALNVGGIVIAIVLPLLIFRFRKPSWRGQGGHQQQSFSDIDE
ncbi:amino acid permease [Microbulbifer sp. OS29]|uniref:Amino acid permease n=1 Tax=Microbulbifer okhotskensis TaxID=2926617 RepID=A0A9X2ER63_9GAMM|nr:amino acid permease [Microbulbifer okhotskensis]MCO1334238.1 amino acid permease [Microbulbifer okhotskensis]